MYKSNGAIPKEIANDYKLQKYYAKRFDLFSRYNDGIKLDRGIYIYISYLKRRGSVSRQVYA